MIKRDTMSTIRIMLFIIALFLVTGVAACGTETDDDDTIASLSELQTFSDDVKLCTPFLEDSGQDLGDNYLDEWSAWVPQAQGSVLGKIFNSDIGDDECIYNQIELLDSHIEMINEFVDDWDEDGDYTKGNMTATIDNTDKSVEIPYIGVDLWPVSVDRVITLEDSSENLTVHMGFLIDGDTQYIVEQYEIGSTQAGVYYTQRNGDSLRIWHASAVTSKVQFVWEGDTFEKWFKITQCSDSTGNWEVMGGGSVANSSSQMAFMARNDYTNVSDDEYYLTITRDDLTQGDEPDDGITALGDPLSGTGVLAYITEGNDKCFGFLGNNEYPDNISDLAWGQ
jgi:hypothetical protein